MAILSPKTTWLLTAGLALSAATAHAQNNRITDTSFHAWYQWNGDHKLTDKWGIHQELQFRRANLLTDKQQFFVVGGLDYFASSKVLLTVGYNFVQNYPNGDYPAKTSFPEHTILEQVQVTSRWNKLAIVNRYRLEQRFVQTAGTTEFNELNRMRYLLRGTYPLAASAKLYAAASNELFIGFGKNVNYNVFDQNRLYGGFGYKMTPDASLEIGYMNQRVQHRGLAPIQQRPVFENNHTLMVSLLYGIDFRKNNTPAASK